MRFPRIAPTFSTVIRFLSHSASIALTEEINDFLVTISLCLVYKDNTLF